ncbi:MAG: DsrE family protein [Acidobacteriota bacterium]
MARIGILVTGGPFQVANCETAVSIGEAALDKGHEVVFLLSADGVYGPVRPRTAARSNGFLHQSFARLIDRGARVLVCGTAAEARGFACRDYPEGVAVGGQPDFAMLIAEMDRLVSL